MDFTDTQRLLSILERIARALEAIAPKPEPEQTTTEEEEKSE